MVFHIILAWKDDLLVEFARQLFKNGFLKTLTMVSNLDKGFVINNVNPNAKLNLDFNC